MEAMLHILRTRQSDDVLISFNGFNTNGAGLLSNRFEVFAVNFEVREYFLETLDFAGNAESIDQQSIEEFEKEPGGVFYIQREEVAVRVEGKH